MIEQVLTICWNNALLVAVLAVFVFTVTCIWRHAPLAHLLWLVVLMKLVTPPVLNLPMVIPIARESRTDRQAEPTRTVVPTAVPHGWIEPPNRGNGPISNAEDSRLDDAQGWEFRAKGAPLVGRAYENRDASTMATRSWPTWSQAAVVVWIVGTLALLATASLRIKAFHQVVCRAAPGPPALCDDIARLATLAGVQSPDVRVSGARIVPLVMALGSQAVLLLPQSLLSSLNEEERTTVLAHELAHLRRRDHWTSWFTMLLVSIYWWHPVAWFARRQLSRAADECCDGWVVQWFPDKALSYAESMMKTVDFLAAGAQPAPTLASGFGKLRSLQRRLATVIDNRTSCRLRSPIRFALYAIAMLLLLISPLFVLAKTPHLNPTDKALSPFGSLSEEERFPWQPKQLINVFGTHRGRHWWEVYAVAYSPDGRWIATGSGDQHLRLWDARTMRERASVRLPGTVQSVVFAPDGNHLAAGLNSAITPGVYTGQIRVWELSRAQLKEVQRLEGFQNRIVSLAFSPNGKIMAAASRDVHLLDMTGPQPREIQVLPVRDTLWQVAMSPDGKLLAGACGQSLVLWDLSGANRKERARVTTSASSVAFSPNGQTLASGTTYEENAIHIWSLRGQEPKEQVVLNNVSHGDGVAALAFSPDGNVLASSTGYQNAIRLWKMQSGRPAVFADLKGHHSKTFALAFSPDGKQLASASSDHSLRLWTIDLHPRESDVSRSAHEDLGDVCAVEFLPDGQSLVVLHSDSIVHARAATIFKMADPHIATHCELPVDEKYYFVTSRLAPDGRTFATVQRRAKPASEAVDTGQSLASDESSVMLWDLAAGRRLHTLADRFGHVSALAFSPDAQLLSTASRDGKLRVWNVVTGKLIAAAASGVRKVLGLAFVGNGETLISLSDGLSPHGQTQAVIQMWRLRGTDLSAGNHWETRGGERGTFGTLSADGKTAVIQRRGTGVEVWRFQGGVFREQVAIQLTDPQSFVSAVSPDGTMLATHTWGSSRNSVSVWDAASGKIVNEWLMPGDVTSLAFAPDNIHVATANQNSTIYVLRTARAATEPRGNITTEKGSLHD